MEPIFLDPLQKFLNWWWALSNCGGSLKGHIFRPTKITTFCPTKGREFRVISNDCYRQLWNLNKWSPFWHSSIWPPSGFSFFSILHFPLYSPHSLHVVMLFTLTVLVFFMLLLLTSVQGLNYSVLLHHFSASRETSSIQYWFTAFQQ